MFCLTCRKRSIEGWIRLYGEYSVTCNIIIFKKILKISEKLEIFF